MSTQIVAYLTRKHIKENEKMTNTIRFNLYDFNGFTISEDDFNDLMMRSCEITDTIKIRNRKYLLFHTLVRTRGENTYDYVVSITKQNNMLSQNDLEFLNKNVDLLTSVVNDYRKQFKRMED
jgi:hypothetical protein